MSEKSWLRKGLDLLLETFPTADVQAVGPQGVWWCIVKLSTYKHPYAIWVHTGAVYGMHAEGFVEDDPFLVPEGSPYDGPTVDAGAYV